MIKISIKDAQIGMVAAEPIKTPLGQILALPGTPLTRQLINKMKLYKVGSISIQNPSDAAAPQAGENTAKRTSSVFRPQKSSEASSSNTSLV